MIKSIRTKIILSNLALLCLSALFIGYATYGFMTKSLRSVEDWNVKYIARIHAKELARLIQGKMDVFSEMAMGNTISQYHQTHKNALIMEYFNKYMPEFNELTYINPDGRETLKMVNGKVSDNLGDISNTPLYNELKSHPNKILLSTVILDGNSDESLVKFKYYRENFFDECEGILRGYVTFRHLFKDAKDFAFLGGGHLVVLNQDAQVLMHPEDVAFGQKLSPNKEIEKFLHDLRLEQAGSCDGRLVCKDGVFGYYPLGILGLTVVAILPDKVFVAKLNSLKYFVVSGVLVIALIGILLSFGMASKISHPITNLVEATELMAKGNLSTHVNVKTSDEIGILAGSFNRMTQKIAEAIDAMDKEIIERKLYAEEIRKFKSIADNANYGVAITDLHLNILYINNYFAQLHEYTVDELMGKKITSLFASKKHTKIRFKKGKNQNTDISMLERHHRSKLGRIFPMLTNQITINNDDDQPQYFAITALDLTDRKKLEEEVMKARKIESVGVLAGGIAHDFNNLLTSILGNISLATIEVDGQSQELVSILKNAEMASLRARDLTTQLLAFARGGAPVKKVTSLIPIIRESAEFALKGSNAKLCFDADEAEIWQAEVDNGQFSQVITNLLINAKQAMPKGGTITIRCKNYRITPESHFPVSSGNYIKVSVQDTGIGIPKQSLDKIFDPYFTTKEKMSDRGTGLGLATVYSIVKKHDGHICVQSELGKGTIFEIYIPATSKKQEDAVVNVTSLEQGSGRILIMDDDELICDVMSHMLTKLGYTVDFATDGQEAIQKYMKSMEENRTYAVVIMDLTIPGGMGAKEAVEELIKIDPSVKAVVTSGYANDSIMSDYKEFGFCAVLEKPTPVDVISSTLRNIIGEY